MSNLNETPIWEEGIYQLERLDPVAGGADGMANRQAKQLGNRTAFLKALVEAIQEALDLKAPSTNPTLTGTPKGPTAPVGTSTTQLATTAFVQAAVAALVNQSPATLDTLAELATALGNDPNFATTITTLLGQKAPLASPALTGTPTAPTAVAGTSTTQLATTAFVAAVQTLLTTLINARAPTASPAFSGTPTAPTAATGTSTTQLATTAFVQAAIAALVNASPATLDTLAEIASALGNDPNFATTITTLIGQKAPLASPALTGKPTAPTAAVGLSDGQLANTNFVQIAVQNAIAALVAALPVANYYETTVSYTNGGTLTITHGLGVAPKLVMFELVAIAAVNGLAVGESAELGAQDCSNNLNSWGIEARKKTSSTVTVVIGFNGLTMFAANGAVSGVTSAQVQVKVKVFA
ncbi:hypothetical protein [Pseudomonas sp. UBA6310]|uniref:hypothetical protein n=1 Tax=Pseudomonas sp. UBA6310 TaxID=1947327 RepID=UPI00257B847C|nr:hypothetical protein [Pseudomonas sp. UBA6310]